MKQKRTLIIIGILITLITILVLSIATIQSLRAQSAPQEAPNLQPKARISRISTIILRAKLQQLENMATFVRLREEGKLFVLSDGENTKEE